MKFNTHINITGSILCLLLLLAPDQIQCKHEHEQQKQRIRPPRGYCAHISRALAPTSRCYIHLVGGDQRTKPEAAQMDAAAEELVYVRLETLGESIGELRTRPVNELVAVGVLSQLLGNRRPDDGEQLARVKAQIWPEETTSATATTITATTGECRRSLERFLCRLAYPSCHFRRSDVSALVRPPCREDCLLLRDVLCPNLNWSNFARVLERSFNSTLAAAINELDLENQGVHFEARASGSGDKLSRWRGKLARDDGAGSIYNLNSSIHFYWPHEHSIARCESLPPMRRSTLRHISPNGQKQPPPITLTATNNTAATTTTTNAVDVNHKSKTRASPMTTTMTMGTGSEQPDAHFKWPICSSAGLTSSLKFVPFNTHQQKQTAAAECLKLPNGASYLGTKNRTRTGLACQMWRDQRPHKHTSSELLFDNMREAQNYCRNPGGMELKPWCYTQDERIRWEYCDIESC